MAVPKKKISKSKRDMRRAHQALGSNAHVECPNCGETALSTDLATAYFVGQMATPAFEPQSD